MDRDDPTRDEVRAMLGLGPHRPEPLCDEQGPIPVAPPFRLDEHGRLLPITEEERQLRAEILHRVLKVIASRPDTDPPGTDERVMRAIDSHRPPGQKLFEGYY